jgi:HSP20 family molecular chaperone IbpA
MVSELPEEMKNLACLKSGENELNIVYKRLKEEDSTGLTIEVKSEEQFTNDEHVFFHREEPDENYDRTGTLPASPVL